MRLQILDRILLFSSAAVLLVSIFLVLDEKLIFTIGHREYPDLVQIGTLADSSKDVRRKTQNDFGWAPIRNSNPVYQDDSIFTAANSRAQVEFQDGSRLSIDPRSLVVVHHDEKEKVYNLEYGNIFSSLSHTPVVVYHRKKRIAELRGAGSTFRVTAPDTSPPQISAVKGKVELYSENQKHELHEDETAVIDDAAKKDVIEKTPKELIMPESPKQQDQAPPKLIQPPQAMKMPALPTSDSKVFKSNVYFEWIPVSDYSTFQLQLSSQRDFKVIIIEEQTDRPFLTLDLQPGNYFWRVRAGEKFSEPSEFEVKPKIHLPAPKVPVKELDLEVQGSPQEQSIFADFFFSQAHADEENAACPFKWEAVAGAQKYLIEIASDPHFRSVVVKQTTKEPQFRWSDCSVGKHYWRVTAFNEFGEPGEKSEVSVLKVSKKVSPQPQTLQQPQTVAAVPRPSPSPAPEPATTAASPTPQAQQPFREKCSFGVGAAMSNVKGTQSFPGGAPSQFGPTPAYSSSGGGTATGFAGAVECYFGGSNLGLAGSLLQENAPFALQSDVFPNLPTVSIKLFRTGIEGRYRVPLSSVINFVTGLGVLAVKLFTITASANPGNRNPVTLSPLEWTDNFVALPVLLQTGYLGEHWRFSAGAEILEKTSFDLTSYIPEVEVRYAFGRFWVGLFFSKFSITESTTINGVSIPTTIGQTTTDSIGFVGFRL